MAPQIRKICSFGVVLALSAVIFAGGTALAASSPWWETEHGAVRLIAASDAVGNAEQVRLGLHFRMKPGWKIYWRSPGDAGFPPRPNWAGSENLAEAGIDWPAPERFTVLGLQTMGYRTEVVLPVTATLFEPGRLLRLRTTMPFLTCSEICVPYEAKLALDLPAGPELSTPEEALIDRFAALVPKKVGRGGLRVRDAQVAGSGDAQVLLIRVESDTALAAPDVFVEEAGRLGFGAPGIRIGVDGRQALMRVAVNATRGEATDLAGKEVTLTLVDGRRAVERRVTLAAAVGFVPRAAPPAPVSAAALLAMLGIALLGGLILNLMPCVLPVLSIKLLSVVGHGGGDPRRVRRSFLASAAGIIVSFLVLGTVAVALKSAGLAAGWGIQFQQPLFLAAMVVIIVLFAGNLWGLFEIRLPGAVADAAAQSGSGHGMTSHFLTGAFATLLATPCSAPFLGTAIGFALSRSAPEIYAVFAALGIGLALPYLAVAAAPGLATRLPRPGPWMITLRRILGLALLATAAWLLTVLAAQTGYRAAGMVAVLMATTLVALWQLGNLSQRARRTTWGIVAALAVFAMVASETFAVDSDRRASPSATPAVKAAAGAITWQPFDQVMIVGEVGLGRVVFVDVTADWCLTCQVNKALVIQRGEVLERLRSSGVTAMRADWTRPDKRISEFLALYGRYGIPFNIVYGPGAPEGVPLPEILTGSTVLEALDRAASVRRTVAR